VAFSFYLFSLLRKERYWAIYGTRADVTVTTTKQKIERSASIMKLFNKPMFRFDVFVENINTGMTDRYTVMATDVKQAKKEIKRRLDNETDEGSAGWRPYQFVKYNQ
jgi:hypothetical protein